MAKEAACRQGGRCNAGRPLVNTNALEFALLKAGAGCWRWWIAGVRRAVLFWVGDRNLAAVDPVVGYGGVGKRALTQGVQWPH